jgi:hypothetical protein
VKKKGGKGRTIKKPNRKMRGKEIKKLKHKKGEKGE